jgi:FkbM family methyltransferase
VNPPGLNEGKGRNICDSSTNVASVSLASIFKFNPVIYQARLDEKYSALDEVLTLQTSAVIYPAARIGRAAANHLVNRGIRIAAFGDGDPALWNTLIDSIPVLSPDEIGRQHQHTPILLASVLFDSVIREDLEQRGCENVIPVGYLNLRFPNIFISREYNGGFAAVTDPSNHPAIEEVYAHLVDEESRQTFMSKLAFYVDMEKNRLDAIHSKSPIYFDRTVYKLGNRENMVDGGAYIGDTLAAFRLATHDRFHSYIAFEPNPANFTKLAKMASTDQKRIKPIAAGLARHTSQSRFSNPSRLHDDSIHHLADGEPGGEVHSVISLDEFFADRQPPTLIKMDIEGSEEDALLGASGLMNRMAPKLAISIYHHPTDLWSIPLLIKKINPDYRLYMRHYTREVDDTVCYALART